MPPTLANSRTMPAAASATLQQFDARLLATLNSLDLQARYVVEGFIAGQHRSPFHGFSVEFSEYREYEPGDDLRHVDWRVFARSDRLYVKQYMQETNVRFYLLVDTSGSMDYRGADAWGSKLEVARVLSAALSWMMLKQNDAVGMLAMTAAQETPDFIRPSQKPSQFGLVLRHLERLHAAGGPCFARLLRHATRLVHRRSMAILLSDLLEPAEDLTESFRELRFHGVDLLVLQVLDRDELEFPFGADAVFEDLETGVRRQVAPAAARAKYLERFQAFMARHEEQLRGLEVQHAIVRTDEAPWQAMTTFLTARQRLA